MPDVRESLDQEHRDRGDAGDLPEVEEEDHRHDQYGGDEQTLRVVENVVLVGRG